VHRDLSPGNVLVTSRSAADGGSSSPLLGVGERLLLADLGLCKDLALNSGYTAAGGTDGFRAPELRGGLTIVKPTTDLWSLSALIVWLISGRSPTDQLVLPLVAVAGLPPDLAVALDVSLSPDPSRRHPDPLAWLADVRAGLGRHGERSRASYGTAAAAGPPPGWFGNPADGWDPADPWPAAGPMRGLANGGRAESAGSERMPQTPPGPPYAGWSFDRGVAPPGGVWSHGTPWPPAMAGGPPRSLGWRLRRSAWLLLALPFGLTTWIGFMYVGLRANRKSWLRAAAAYGAGVVVMLAFAIAAPEDPDGQATGWQNTVGTILLVVIWFGGMAHALAANVTWLRWRSYREAAARPDALAAAAGPPPRWPAG
jgi:Protein kinase domain